MEINIPSVDPVWLECMKSILTSNEVIFHCSVTVVIFRFSSICVTLAFCKTIYFKPSTLI